MLGGGITGLAAALRLEELAAGRVDWTLYEAAPRLGGVLRTEETGGYLVEQGADNFLTRDPWATDLCRRVGIEGELLPTDPARRRALVVCHGRVRRVPEGFVLMAPSRAWPILASPLLSVSGKLRLAAEPFAPRRTPDSGDESVASFSRRRLGREAFERLVQPLVGGIYTADPDRLSMAATLPQFLRDEAEHGSLLREAWRRRRAAPAEAGESGARYGLFVAPRRGMQQLVDAVASRLPEGRVRLSTPVAQVEQRPEGCFQLLAPGGATLGEPYDRVVVTLPAARAADALRPLSSPLADALGRIAYAGASVVCLGLREEQVRRTIDGFGFVVPAVEGRRVLAASFASYKFPGRCPEGRVLVRVFVGGALQPELADLDDAALVRLACEELAELVGLNGAPELAQVARWKGAMPQYHVGHLDRVAAIEHEATEAGVELAGAAYRGVGVPQCVHSGEQSAERALAALGLLATR